MPSLHDFDVPTNQYLSTGLYITFTCAHDATIIEIIITDGAKTWYVVPAITPPPATGDPATGGWEINRGFHTFVWDGHDPSSGSQIAAGTNLTVHINHATPYTGYTALTLYNVSNVVLS